LTQVVGMNAVASVPSMANDMLGAMLDFILVEIGQTADEIFLIDVELFVSDTRLECSQLYLPKPETLDAVIAALGM